MELKKQEYHWHLPSEHLMLDLSLLGRKWKLMTKLRYGYCLCGIYWSVHDLKKIFRIQLIHNAWPNFIEWHLRTKCYQLVSTWFILLKRRLMLFKHSWLMFTLVCMQAPELLVLLFSEGGSILFSVTIHLPQASVHFLDLHYLLCLSFCTWTLLQRISLSCLKMLYTWFISTSSLTSMFSATYIIVQFFHRAIPYRQIQ